MQSPGETGVNPCGSIQMLSAETCPKSKRDDVHSIAKIHYNQEFYRADIHLSHYWQLRNLPYETPFFKVGLL